MADFTTLKAQVAAVVRANGIQDIKGENLQAQLFNIIDTMNTAKVDAVSGKGLSTNDLTTALVNLINSSVQPAALASAIATAVADLVAKADIVQATGTDTTKVMSQKATTDGLAGKANTADVVLKTDIASAQGSSGTKVMSQASITNALAAKADASNVFTKAEITTSLAEKADAADVYTKTQANALLANKADVGLSYTKNETDTLLGAKASSTALDTEVAARQAADTANKGAWLPWPSGVTPGTSLAPVDTLEFLMSILDRVEAGKVYGGNVYLSDAPYSVEHGSTLVGYAILYVEDTNAHVYRMVVNNTDVAPYVFILDAYNNTWLTPASKADVADAIRMARDFGKYDNPTETLLSVGVNGKYVDKDSAQEVSNSAYAISNAISLNAGDILLIPSASAVLAACSVVSKKLTNTFNEPILYTYTYDTLGRIASAAATYDTSLVYAAHYAGDETTTPDYWTKGGDTYNALPSTHEVTKSFYEPLVKQSVAGMPSTGYYVYLASQAMQVVVSGLTSTINGGKAIIAGWGLFKNIAINFVGIDKQRVIAEALNTLSAQVDAINDKLNNGIGSLKVQHLKVGRELSGLNVNGTFCLHAAGAPSASLVPDNWDAATYGDWMGVPQFIGQEYADTTNRIIYKAIGVSSISDWIRISNA